MNQHRGYQIPVENMRCAEVEKGLRVETVDPDSRIRTWAGVGRSGGYGCITRWAANAISLFNLAYTNMGIKTLQPEIWGACPNS